MYYFIKLFITAACAPLIISVNYNHATQKNSKRVCVIGAGIAGLTSARYLKEEGINFTVFETTQYVGGTWRYDPRTGKDENGQPLHTSMYKHLRTNLPKPTMELRGFPLPDNIPSFPSWEIFYKYLKDYAAHFDLYRHIQFLHNVVLVLRKDDAWRVTYQNVKTGEIFVDEFDYVIVGNGHFSTPSYPDIRGEERFKGRIIHSHDYKDPDLYKDRRVLVVGAGPSGWDIGLDVASSSKSLIHSHHSVPMFNMKNFPPNYVKKPDIREFNETGPIFVDGTHEEIDDVIYCTGFLYDYPFLDESSGLSITPHSVVPLYRYMVSIKQPTMVLLGLTVRTCLIQTLDAQARYATALIKGNFSLPSHDEMMDEWQTRLKSIQARGLRLSKIHLLAEKEDEYYAQLSAESGIERVPPVMFKIRLMDTHAKLEDLTSYRNYVYTVIDNNNFTTQLETPLKNSSLRP